MCKSCYIEKYTKGFGNTKEREINSVSKWRWASRQEKSSHKM